jgi:DNA (cytosine-5)-methyltransferase 1
VGNRAYWTPFDAEHEITDVEWKPEIAEIYHDNFPKDTIVVADAHEYLLKNYRKFDFIWSSPPCPTHSKARFGLGYHGGKVDAVYPDMSLYQEIVLLKHHFKGKWVVENVMAYYEPLIVPQTLGRHWFWTNFPMPDFYIEPSYISQQSKKYSKTPMKAAQVNDFEARLGFDLTKYKIANKILLLRNCVEPELGKHILDWSQKEWHHTKSLPIGVIQ